MIRYAEFRLGPGFDFRRALAYYAQRLVTPRVLRRAVSHVLAATISFQHGKTMRQRCVQSATDAANTLERDGLVRLSDLLQPDKIADMVRFFSSKRVVVGRDPHLVPLEDLPPGVAMAAYPLETVVACPGLLEAINSPAILQIATRYLGCKPTISSLGVRWSLPRAGTREQTQAFHRDPDDWRFLKLFIYLSDVDTESGPHVYVTTSHRTRGTLRSRYYSRETLEKRFGAEKIRTIAGARGTTFMADTHGIHMGVPPRRAPRLILQAQYSILPVFAFLYEPVIRPAGITVDPYVNRLLINQSSDGAYRGSVTT